MADIKDDNFGQELADAFAADEAAAAPQAPAPDVPKVEEPKKDEPATPEVPKEGEPATPPAIDEEKPADGVTQPKAPETPATTETPAPQPLTRDDVTSIISNLRTEERTSGQALNTATNDVMDAYYPEGLSNVLIDQNSGKELRTPQDVVDASGGEMPLDQAQQWLMNEQYKLDQNITKIKDDAKGIAETTLKFKQDTVDVLTRYKSLFEAYPTVQEKVWNQYNKLVKADMVKNVILSAPDMRDFYDNMLDPYRMAYEFSQKKPATAPVPVTVVPVAPGTGDRLDEGGDGGASPVNDPNDFAQQVSKELAKGM